MGSLAFHLRHEPWCSCKAQIRIKTDVTVIVVVLPTEDEGKMLRLSSYSWKTKVMKLKWLMQPTKAGYGGVCVHKGANCYSLPKAKAEGPL